MMGQRPDATASVLSPGRASRRLAGALLVVLGLVVGAVLGFMAALVFGWIPISC